MFILKDEIKAWWPIKVKEPDPKKIGIFVEHKFEAEITLLDRDKAKARDDARLEILSGEGDPKEIVEAINAFDDETYLDLISDWRGVYDEAKREVPFDRDILIKALRMPHVRAAIQRAYEEMASGEIRKKN